jgi:hypothetical protein
MQKQQKTIIQGKVEKKDKKKFKVKAHKPTEVDADIEIVDEGDYQVDKLSVDDLPAIMPDGKTKIVWLNNFSIKKGNDYINQPYKVTIPGLGKKQIVIIDNNSNGNPYNFTGPVVNDTIELSDGDPGIGQT